MGTSRLLFLIFVVLTTSECSETEKPQCKNFTDFFNILEGEAFYFEPSELPDSNVPDEEFTWYKNTSKSLISTDESENVHYHGGALFFLNILPENSGFYVGRHTKPSGECYNYHLELTVLKARNDTALLYGSIENSDLKKMVPCPDPLRYTCEIMKGNISWYKDFSLLQDERQPDLWVPNTTRKDEGIYTCICSWEHNRKVYNSSGSRRLIVKSPGVHRLQVTSPNKLNKEQFADEGYEIKLNCSIICGTNVKTDCRAFWDFPFKQNNGYNQSTNLVIDNRSLTISSTAILTIEKVSAKDFQTEFKCKGVGFYSTVSETLTLKQRESIIPLVIGGVCVFLLCVFAAILVKCFAIDLALFFRPYLPLSSHKNDMRVYDAYVVYQMQNLDKDTEDALCQFVTKNLPSILEEKCGYRLFIHGRDDIPGEDRLELVEDRMKQSRRLMVILTPGSGSGSEITDQHPVSPQNSALAGFDWQVGLHHVLIQREMSVILIQLGDTGPQGYAHLPPGLQHLIRKSAPIRWPEGSQAAATWNSRFWKRVRYLMPATPAKKSPLSAII